MNWPKYLCIGNDKIEAEWLPRWYGVPHDECVFRRYNKLFKQHEGTGYPDTSIFIKLKPLPKGTNYKQHLNILKTERLLNGNDVREY